jgi:hypothetical protein
MEIDRKKDVVLAWAGNNWERLYEQADKETKESKADFNNALSKQMQAFSQNQAFSALGLNMRNGSIV